jgi:hypothetical protein
VDKLLTDVSDDAELDALMARVREAALGGGSRGSTVPSQPHDATGPGLDLLRVIDAQAEWNEHASKSLAAVVASLRTLRDDWAEAHSRIGREIERLSAIVERRPLGAEKNPRQKATERRTAVKRRKPGKRNGHRT